jgi:hypothetical protein
MFITDELVWAITREREEDVRKVRPHTERSVPADEVHKPSSDVLQPAWLGLQPSLKS